MSNEKDLNNQTKNIENQTNSYMIISFIQFTKIDINSINSDIPSHN